MREWVVSDSGRMGDDEDRRCEVEGGRRGRLALMGLMS